MHLHLILCWKTPVGGFVVGWSGAVVRGPPPKAGAWPPYCTESRCFTLPQSCQAKSRSLASHHRALGSLQCFEMYDDNGCTSSLPPHHEMKSLNLPHDQHTLLWRYISAAFCQAFPMFRPRLRWMECIHHERTSCIHAGPVLRWPSYIQTSPVET